MSPKPGWLKRQLDAASKDYKLLPPWQKTPPRSLREHLHEVVDAVIDESETKRNALHQLLADPDVAAAVEWWTENEDSVDDMPGKITESTIKVFQHLQQLKEAGK